MENKETEELLQEIGASCTLYEAYSILCRLVEMGEIQKDPNTRDNILVYMQNGHNGDGWYSQNIFSAANDLMFDTEGIDFLLEEIRKNDPSFIPEKPPKLVLSNEEPNIECNGMTEDEAMDIITQNLHQGNLTLALDIAKKSISELQKYRSMVEDMKPYAELAEKLNLCDLVRENSRLSNKVRLLEAQRSSDKEKLDKAESTIHALLTSKYKCLCQFCVHGNNPDAECRKLGESGGGCYKNAKWNGKGFEET